MKQRRLLYWLLGLSLCLITSLSGAQNLPEEKRGWQLGAQAYTFRELSFDAALDRIDSCGLKYVEAFTRQQIGNGISGTMDYHMEPATRTQVLAMLKQKGITMLSYGVVSADNEQDWQQLFEFAKGMGLKQIASEPDPKFLPLVSKLADQYNIRVALHNHPRPSRYWSPDTVLKYTAGLSKRIGACADIGHWVRSGLDPVACLKQLQGLIFELHFKDLHEKPSAEYLAAQLVPRPPASAGARPAGPPAGGVPGPHDVPWGTGISNIDGVLAELKRQGFKGPMFAEYEYHWGSNGAEVAESVRNLREKIKTLK
jgi:sugar phosphate isomerase/epimerase